MFSALLGYFYSMNTHMILMVKVNTNGTRGITVMVHEKVAMMILKMASLVRMVKSRNPQRAVNFFP